MNYQINSIMYKQILKEVRNEKAYAKLDNNGKVIKYINDVFGFTTVTLKTNPAKGEDSLGQSLNQVQQLTIINKIEDEDRNGIERIPRKAKKSAVRDQAL